MGTNSEQFTTARSADATFTKPSTQPTYWASFGISCAFSASLFAIEPGRDLARIIVETGIIFTMGLAVPFAFKRMTSPWVKALKPAAMAAISAIIQLAIIAFMMIAER